MQNSTPLVFLGVAIIVTAFLNVVVPYLRHKSELLTAWNIVWLGGALFTGVGSLAVAYGHFHWPELQWFQPTTSDIGRYIVGSIVFYGTMLFTYYGLSWPKRVVARFLNKWPPMSLPMLICCLSLFGAVAIGATVFEGKFFFGPLLYNMVHKALVFAVVFSFCYWYPDKWQMPKLALFLAVFLFAALDSMVLFHGRRLFLSVAVAPVICLYWLRWRDLPPVRNLVRVAIAVSLIFCVIVVYSTFRHFSGRSKGLVERTFSTTLQAMKGTSAESAFGFVTRDPYYYLSQYCAHYSLLTIHLLDAGEIKVQPLDSLLFLATYPIPRAVFPSKPQPLGIRMVKEILRLPYPTNWGLGIVANGYQEGGLPVIVLYAVLIVIGVRVLDDALVRQPHNAFLLAILTTSAPHLATLIRGEPRVMSAEIIEAFAFAWIVGLGCRFAFGTARPDSLGVAQPPIVMLPSVGNQFRRFRR